MDNPFLDYYRCSSELANFDTPGVLSADECFFTFQNAIGYGRLRVGCQTQRGNNTVPDVSHHVDLCDARVNLPFDLSAVVDNLRDEKYYTRSLNALEHVASAGLLKSAYYLARPMLPVAVRKHLQRIRLRGWDRIAFPRWPVECAVDELMQNAMTLALKSRNISKTPFIWFWPDGAAGGLILTHDVEDQEGQDFCGELMDIDESFGFKSAFQVVPERRGNTTAEFIKSIRDRGFEVNIHDLNHDGYLFHNKQLFDKRAVAINKYAREFGSRGFRSGAMYRQQSWYDALDISFDMSVPNVAHLEPQRGGCCTVMPYFVGRVLELPLTTIQDYSLFHILNDYSIALWKEQIAIILSQNGLITLLAHPDYLIEQRARAVYVNLLTYIRQVCDERKLWMAFPGEVDTWWRQRHSMKLVRNGNGWRIDGEGSNRARIAYAVLEGDRIVYQVDPQS